MNCKVLFGDPARSPIWAIVMEGEESGTAIEVPAEMVSIVVVTEGSVSWEANKICELSASAIITRSQKVSVTMEDGGDATIVAFSREVFKSLVQPFASELIPDLVASLADVSEQTRGCSLMAPFALFSRIVPE